MTVDRANCFTNIIEYGFPEDSKFTIVYGYEDLTSVYQNNVGRGLTYNGHKAIPAVVLVQTNNTVTPTFDHQVTPTIPITPDEIKFIQPLDFLNTTFDEIEEGYLYMCRNATNTQHFIHMFTTIINRYQIRFP
jgi:hypothetical protein